MWGQPEVVGLTSPLVKVTLGDPHQEPGGYKTKPYTTHQSKKYQHCTTQRDPQEGRRTDATKWIISLLHDWKQYIFDYTLHFNSFMIIQENSIKPFFLFHFQTNSGAFSYVCHTPHPWYLNLFDPSHIPCNHPQISRYDRGREWQDVCMCILSSNYTSVNVQNKTLHFWANIQKHLPNACLYYLIILISFSYFPPEILWSTSLIKWRCFAGKWHDFFSTFRELELANEMKHWCFTLPWQYAILMQSGSGEMMKQNFHCMVNVKVKVAVCKDHNL